MGSVNVELDKLKGIKIEEIDSWNELEQLGYMLKYAHVENKHGIIELLEKKSEVFKDMMDMRDEMLYEKGRSMGELKAFFDKCDEEKRVKWAEDYGRKEGRAEGLAEGQADILRKLLSNGMSIETIASYTGYSVEELGRYLR